MKERERKAYINKNWQKGLGIICLLGLILASVVFLMDSSQEKKEVSAHPDNPISIGSGDATFDLPSDADGLEEQAIIDMGGSYSGYVQDGANIPVLRKERVSAKGTVEVDSINIPSSIRSIMRTSYGHFFVLYGFGGAGKGGVIKASIFDETGQELATIRHGTMSNAALRIDTPVYDAESNSFLIGTSSGPFFRITVENESSTGASLSLTPVDVPNNPVTAMRANTSHIVDRLGQHERRVLVGGRIIVDRATESGVIHGRIPFGYVDVTGWRNAINPGFNGAATEIFSVESLRNDDIGLGAGGNLCFASPSNMFQLPGDNNILFGTFYNTKREPTGDLWKNSFQIFDLGEVVDVNGQQMARRMYEDFNQRNEDFHEEYTVLKELCTDENIYYLRHLSNSTELVEVSLTDYVSRVVKEYPFNTFFNIINNNDGLLSFYGYTTSLTGEFASDFYPNDPSVSNYFVSGIMREPSDANRFDIVSIRALETSGMINTTHVLNIPDTNNIFVGGYTSDTSSSFVDDLEILDSDGNIINGNNVIFSSPVAFAGVFEIRDDYSPIINAPESITVDIASDAIINPTPSEYRGWSTLDRWLITGSENGNVADASSIKVYDHFDNNDSQIGATPELREQWLQRRINRNPKDLSTDIEWETLGFDKNKVGPQLVTYFVTDSQSQPTVSSRWINAKGPQTITDEDEEYALDAQNFHIPLTNIDTAIADENKFKELAKTLAWSLTDNEENSGEYGNGLDEDGASKNASSVQNKLSTKVTVDNTQLAALQNATEARPYPVDVTYTPDGQDPIINRVWVFVTTTNTVPNTGESPADTNGVVYYADDYSMPYRLRHNHDLSDILTNGNVKAYNYYSKDRSNDELTPLPNTTDGQSNWIIHNLDVIHDPFQSGMGNLPMNVRPRLSYIWRAESDYYHERDEETRGSLQVTLTGNVLLHVRQVILDENEELVFPTEGYLKLKTLRFDQSTHTFTEDTSQLVNVCIPSQKTNDTPRFEIFGYDSAHMLQEDNFKIELILPEFYEYVGYFLTHRHLEDPNDPMGGDHQGKVEIDLYGGEVELDKMSLDIDGEYFITLYIRPTTAGQSPQPYSWDYKHNELGEIKTE